MNDPSSHALPLERLLGHAADAVQAVRAGRSLNDALARCPAPARPGTQAIAFDVLRTLGTALALRERLAPRTPPPQVDALLLTALALLWPAEGAAYAEHTLVDQAVAAARRRTPASAGFVNAVLRRCVRERAALAAALAGDAVARFNHPPWWLQRLQHDWPEAWAAIVAQANQRPPMTLRVNARRTSVPDWLQRAAAEGIQAQALGGQAVRLAQPLPVQRLPGFAQGEVSVQDAAAQMAAPLLIGAGLPAGARVLDACAAPGGKTAHLLELADLDVLAIDSDPQRLPRIGENLRRLGLQARTRAADALDPGAWWDGQPFDAILLDAPCSASGIVRRHPDVRWLRREGDIEQLAGIQDRLLEVLWPLLAPGGRLLYATCSVFRAEGCDRIDAFLQRHGDARTPAEPPSPGHLLPLPDNALAAIDAATATAPDGFFYALIEKT